MPIYQKKNLIIFILCLIAFVDQASISLIVPLLPELLNELTGETLAKNSIFGGWLVIIYALMQFIFAPIIGNLSDKYGRKPVLIACMFFFSIDYIIMALATNVWLLFIGRILAGITGASIITVKAVLTDISSDQNRVANFSTLIGVGSIAFMLGPILGAGFAQFGLRVPFIIAAVLCIINLLLVIKFLPETLNKETETETKRNHISLLKPLVKMIKYPGFSTLLLSELIIIIAFQAPVVLWAFYMSYKFNFTTIEVGLSLSFFGFLVTLVNLFLVRYTYPILGSLKSIYLGSFFSFLGFILLIFATNNYLIYLALFFYALGSISVSAINNLFIINVSDKDQGKLQGILASIESLSAIIGPLVMTYLFYWGIQSNFAFGSDAPFILGAILICCNILLIYCASRKLENID